MGEWLRYSACTNKVLYSSLANDSRLEPIGSKIFRIWTRPINFFLYLDPVFVHQIQDFQDPDPVKTKIFGPDGIYTTRLHMFRCVVKSL